MKSATHTLFVSFVMILAAVGCKSPQKYRMEADKVAASIIKHQQKQALGRSEPFTIEKPADTLRRRLLFGQKLPFASKSSLGADQLDRIKHWPEKDYPFSTPSSQPATIAANKKPLFITLMQALQIAARNNRDYQSNKENIFIAALNLDLESNEFRNTFTSMLSATASLDKSGDHSVGGITGNGEASWSRKFKSGATLTSRIGIDLVRLLTGDRHFTRGLFADTSISIPLLRGSSKHIVAEPLTQAQRDVIYSIYTFERYKRKLAVQTASQYLSVLQQLDQITNARENYRGLVTSAARAQRLSDAGRLSKIEVNQARQDELRARERLIQSRDNYQSSLDSLKITLGLPTDARIELDPRELNNLTGKKISAQDAGVMELPENQAVKLALDHRLDLRQTQGEVFDAQRAVVVAADALRMDLTLGGSASAGASRSLSSVDSDDAQLRAEKGVYSLQIQSDLPWERTSERNAYRTSFISLEKSIRSVQSLEDHIKLDIRNALRTLRRTRESSKIQAQSLQLARRRVASTNMFLKAGRAQMRDILEAQEALISAQNAMTTALVNYRVAELELQRDMGVLEVNEKGIWREYKPRAKK